MALWRIQNWVAWLVIKVFFSFFNCKEQDRIQNTDSIWIRIHNSCFK